MNKNFTLLFLILISFSCSAQKLDKIKGNKEVVDIYETLEAFTSLEVSSGLEISIKQGDEEGYHLEADSNLVDVISFEVVEDKLHIYAKSSIQSSKRLKIDLTVANLDMITINDGAEINTLNKIEATSLTLVVLDNSEYKLDLKADELSVTMGGSSKGDLAFKGEKLSVTLNDNSTLKGDLTITECVLAVNEKADFDMDGDVVDLNLTITGTASVKASVLRAETVNLIASDNCDIYVNATKNLTIYAQDKSTINLYGNPEIIIEGFKDSSRLIKK